MVDNLQWKFSETVPEGCQVCDLMCEGITTQCFAEYCLSTHIVYTVAFAVLGTVLCFRLWQIWKNSPKAAITWSGIARDTWMAKKIIFLSGITFCYMRALRFGLLLAKIQIYGRIVVLFDQFIYWLAFLMLYIMYSVMLSLWNDLVQKSNLASNWFSSKTKRILIVVNLGLAVLSFLVSVSIVYWVGLLALFNGIVAVSCLAFSISYLFEGRRVYKIISGQDTLDLSGSGSIPQGKGKVKLQAATLLAIYSSLGYLFGFIMIIALTAVRSYVVKESHIMCQTTHLIYRIYEFVLVSVICFYFRRTTAPTPSISHNDSVISLQSWRGSMVQEE